MKYKKDELIVKENVMKENKITINKLVETEGFKKFIKQLEFICAITLVMAILMFLTKFTNSKYFGLIFTLSFSLLSIIYFFKGFEKYKSNTKILSNIFYKIYGWGLSISFITLLFILKNWYFSEWLMLILSLTLVLLSLLLGIKERSRNNIHEINWLYFFRLLVVIIPLMYFLIQRIMG